MKQKDESLHRIIEEKCKTLEIKKANDIEKWVKKKAIIQYESEMKNKRAIAKAEDFESQIQKYNTRQQEKVKIQSEVLHMKALI